MRILRTVLRRSHDYVGPALIQTERGIYRPTIGISRTVFAKNKHKYNLERMIANTGFDEDFFWENINNGYDNIAKSITYRDFNCLFTNTADYRQQYIAKLAALILKDERIAEAKCQRGDTDLPTADYQLGHHIKNDEERKIYKHLILEDSFTSLILSNHIDCEYYISPNTANVSEIGGVPEFLAHKNLNKWIKEADAIVQTYLQKFTMSYAIDNLSEDRIFDLERFKFWRWDMSNPHNPNHLTVVPLGQAPYTYSAALENVIFDESEVGKCSEIEMPLNVLYESPVGFALFQVLDEGKVKDVSNVENLFSDPSQLSGVLELKKFKKFTDQVEATQAAVSLTEGKIAKSLKKMLKKLVKEDVQDTLAVADTKLGGIIRESLGIECIHSPAIHELTRGIREHLNELTGIQESERSAMALGLAHSLSRYKLKFSPDKVDTMIVQAISLLDDLDKELNNYVMRVREWYGWHFPELGKVVTDNLAYAKTIQKMTYRTNCSSTDFSDILPEEIEEQVKELAEVSMGTDVNEEDMSNIMQLADQVIEITQYRAQLFEYLKNRMAAIAPNLTVLVGELVGARLIAHAGSLLNLAKHPASTVQILGAEKALFRALKTKQDTPKYGLIYHASMVGQATPKNKGKISRMLAAKAALAIRYDALCEGEDEANVEFAIEARTALEKRAKELELRKLKIGGRQKTPKKDKYRHKSEVVKYDAAEDQTAFKRKGEDGQETPAKKKTKKEKVKEEPVEERTVMQKK